MGRYSLHEYIENLDVLGERNNIGYILSDLAMLICIVVMFLSLPIGIVALLIVLCHNIIGYFKEYKEIEPYITSFRYINRVLDTAEQLGKKR